MLTKRIVLVGEAYGREEEKYNRCFIGPAGQLLIQALRQCGFERHQVHLTNVCMFRPSDESGGNRPPTEEEINREFQRLAADIRGFETVICLGATAHRTLHPYGNGWTLSSCLGLKIPKGRREDAQMFVSIWHPAYILRNRHLMPEYVSLIRTALQSGGQRP